MSSITSGIGLVSGLPIQDLVDSLILVQRRPISLLQNRLSVLIARRTALLQISAQLLSIRSAASRLSEASFFSSATVESSDTSAILATVEAGADAGDFTFTVRNLAASQQLIAAGFATADATPVGAGTLTIERAAGRLDRSTELGSLHGGAGVQVGKIRISDRTGSTVVVDLVGAQTVDDVIALINAENGINVRADVQGDRIVLTDTVGGTGNLEVAEIGTGRTAGDLGILQSAAADELIGNSIVSITEETRLSRLNDGNGVRAGSGLDFEVALADGLSPLQFDITGNLKTTTPLALLNSGSGVPDGTIRITDRSGKSAEIDLTGAVTIGDVLSRINGEAGIDVTASIRGSTLELTDDSLASGQTAANDLLIEDVDSTTAEALGLKGSALGTVKAGRDVYAVDTVGDLLRIINLDPNNGGRLVASISGDGLGITLTDTTTGTGAFAITALADGTASVSKTAEDLGLLGPITGNTISSTRLVSQLNTVLLRSLNGGQGVDLSDLQIKDRSGTVLQTIDLSNATTLADVLDAINAASTSITAKLSASGLGIELIDTSGGSGNFQVTGATAAALNIAIDASADRVESGNLQRQYISEATRLADLDNGNGLPRGKFRITDSNGQTATVDLGQGDEKTLRDVIDEINSRPTGIRARINDSGDGLILEDTAGGTGTLTVAEDGSTVARILGILGQADAGDTFLDGTFETRITVTATDTLQDVLSRIQSSDAEVNATIINDGSSGRPFRLSLTSTRSGLQGALAIDGGATGLSFDILSQARNATVVFGANDSDAPLVFTSATNTLTNVIENVRIDLISATNQPVTISVKKDVDEIVNQVQDFVTRFNDVISTLDELTSFDPETELRGILQGDATARRVRQALQGLVNKTVVGLPASADRLSDAGVTLSGGTSLTLDEDKLRQALENDPDGILQLFTLEETDDNGDVIRQGFGGIIQTEIDRLTEADNGVIPLTEGALQASEEQLSGRIDQLEELLDRRRVRLFQQFNTMESIIANLQSQQSALSSLVGLGPI